MEFNPELVELDLLKDLAREQQVKYIVGFLNINTTEANIARFEDNISKEKLKEHIEVIGKSKLAEEQALKMEKINLELNLSNLELLNKFISLKK